jgi:hypothetical protein
MKIFHQDNPPSIDSHRLIRCSILSLFLGIKIKKRAVPRGFGILNAESENRYHTKLHPGSECSPALQTSVYLEDPCRDKLTGSLGFCDRGYRMVLCSCESFW